MPRKSVVVINPLFKLLVIINATLCVVSFLALVGLAAWGPDNLTKAQDRLLNACEHILAGTVGAFLGLLGGRAAAPDMVDDLEPTSRATPARAATARKKPDSPAKKPEKINEPPAPAPDDSEP